MWKYFLSFFGGTMFYIVLVALFPGARPFVDWLLDVGHEIKVYFIDFILHHIHSVLAFFQSFFTR